MSLLHRGAHSKKRPSVYSTIAELEEEEQLMLLEPENLPETHVRVLPLGVVEVLDKASTPRKNWPEIPCPLCDEPFKSDTVIRHVLLGDGSRHWVHDHHFNTGDLDPETCKHGITPAATCTWCNGSERPVFPKSRAFRARLDGTCAVCDVPFTRGTLIQKMTGTHGEGFGHAWHVTK